MFHSRVFGVVGLCGLSVTAQLGFAGAAVAADGDPVVTASAATLSPGGPKATVTVEASSPFEITFAGTGNQSLGWELPAECNNNAYPAVCTPGPSGKVLIPIGVLGGDQGGKKGQQVTFQAKSVATKATDSVTVTFTDAVTAADWVVEHPQAIAYQNPGGKLTTPFSVVYFQRHTTTDSATVTVTGVKGAVFTKAPDTCTLNASGTVVTCQVEPYKGGFGPNYLPLEGTISGNEQIIETKVAGTLPENTPADNTLRTVYKNTVQPASASPGTPTTAPATKAADTNADNVPVLAETGGDGGTGTTVIAGTAAGLLLLGGGATVLARRRNRSTN